jgi:hypothetical protein
MTSTVRGLIGDGGHVRGGAGFGVERNGPGAYTIAYLEPFAEPPAIVVTPGQERRIASASSTAVGAEVTLADLDGRPTDTDFAFIAEPV